MNPSKRQIAIGLLLVAAAINAGCAASKEAPPLNASQANPAQASSVERVAATQPPRHPLLELIKCIVETDDMSDPDRLYGQVLDIKNYSKVQQTWGYQIFARNDQANLDRLPFGITSINYTKNTQKEASSFDRRHLFVGLDRNLTCIDSNQITETFGHEYRVFHEVIAPTPSQSLSSDSSSKSNPYGISYTSKNQPKGDLITTISFTLNRQKCLKDIEIDIARNK